MGLFSKKEVCSICRDISGKPIADGYVCDNCWKKCGQFAIFSGQERKLARVLDVSRRIQQNTNFKQSQEERQKIFSPNRIIASKIFVDENNNLWCSSTGAIKLKPQGAIYSLNDVTEYQIVEDGDSVTKGGLGRAVAGGALFGGVGAIVGGVTGSKKTRATCTKLFIEVRIEGAPLQPVVLPYIFMETKKTSSTYKLNSKLAKELFNYFDKKANKDINTNEEDMTTIQAPSSADEIKKYADLYAQGIITNEEFTAAKKKLLDL